MDILALLQPIEDSLSKTTLRQMSRIIIAMLAMTGRVTMLGVARWAGKGGSYRTIQRFYNTAIPWPQVFWLFFRQHLFEQGETYILAGDESVVSKAGKKTYGLDRFFSGLPTENHSEFVIFHNLAGQCQATTFLSSVRRANRAQRRRKGSLQSQERGQKNQICRAETQTRASEGQQKQSQVGSYPQS